MTKNLFSKGNLKISFPIHGEDKKYHRNGINAVQMDYHEEKLYSAGKKSFVSVLKLFSQTIN